MDIKNAWHTHPMTCLAVSSADMLQFAAFFVTTRQKNGPESLTSGTITANAKRDTLKTDFLWGRPDEINCDIAWTDNLPGFKVASGEPIPARCIASGVEIKEKMMDRNGFTAGKNVVCKCHLIMNIKKCPRETNTLPPHPRIRGSDCSYWRSFNWDDS